MSSIVPATLLVGVLSFGSSMALATQLGATNETDAYYIALSVPTLAYGVLVAALRLGAIPVMTQIDVSESIEQFSTACNQLVSATFVGAVALSAVSTAVMMIVLPTVAEAGASEELASLTRLYLFELSPYAVTGALLGVLGAILAVRGSFVAAVMVLAFEPALKTILVLTFGQELGAQTLIIGNLLGGLIAVAMLWTLLRRHGVSVRPVGFTGSPVVRSIFLLSVPLMISQSLLSLNPLIDRAAAAGLEYGSVTIFELGVRLFSMPTSLLTGMLITPLAATWAARLDTSGWSSVVESFGKVLTVLLLIVPPLVVLGFVMRQELVSVAYLSERYSALDVRLTADVLGVLLLGLLPQVTVVAIVTLFIVQRNTVFPMLVGVANFVLNLTLNVVLRGPLGVSGIALSTTITLTVLCVLLVAQAQRLWGTLRLREAVPILRLSMTSCVFIGATSMLVQQLGPTQASRSQAAAMILIARIAALIVHSLALFLGRSTISAVLASGDLWSPRSIGGLLRGRDQ